MRYLLILLLAMSIGTTACSKKKSSSVATPPTTTDTDTDTDTDLDTDCNSGCDVVTIPGMAKPANSKYYVGKVTGINKTVYKKFIKAGLGANSDGGAFGDGGNYSWNYQCDFNIFAFLFQGEGFNCQTQAQKFETYVTTIASKPAIVIFRFIGNGNVQGTWFTDAYLQLNGNINYYMAIPFQGPVVKLSDGRYLIEAGPLSLVTATASTKTNFDAYFFDGTTDVKFGSMIFK